MPFKDKEKMKAYMKSYRQANREKLKAQQKIYRQATPEKQRAYSETFYRNNKDKKKAYYLRHLDKIKARNRAYHLAHPDKKQICNRKYIASKRGVQHKAYATNYIFERDNWTCQICGRKINRRLKWPNPLSKSIDHIVPLSRGGNDSPVNVQATHLRCNLGKNATNKGQLRLFG